MWEWQTPQNLMSMRTSSGPTGQRSTSGRCAGSAGGRRRPRRRPGDRRRRRAGGALRDRVRDRADELPWLPTLHPEVSIVHRSDLQDVQVYEDGIVRFDLLWRAS
jgi:hypothetical protein